MTEEKHPLQKVGAWITQLEKAMESTKINDHERVVIIRAIRTRLDYAESKLPKKIGGKTHDQLR